MSATGRPLLPCRAQAAPTQARNVPASRPSLPTAHPPDPPDRWSDSAQVEVAVISADVPHRHPVHSSRSLAAVRLVVATAAVTAGAFGLGLGFHVGVALADGRVLVTYPGAPRPGETVLAPHTAAAQFVTAGPATLAAADGHLVVDGTVTTWAVTAPVPPVVPAGTVLVFAQDRYSVVAAAGVCLASPL